MAFFPGRGSLGFSLGPEISRSKHATRDLVGHFYRAVGVFANLPAQLGHVRGREQPPGAAGVAAGSCVHCDLHVRSAFHRMVMIPHHACTIGISAPRLELRPRCVRPECRLAAADRSKTGRTVALRLARLASRGRSAWRAGVDQLGNRSNNPADRLPAHLGLQIARHAAYGIHASPLSDRCGARHVLVCAAGLSVACLTLMWRAQGAMPALALPHGEPLAGLLAQRKIPSTVGAVPFAVLSYHAQPMARPSRTAGEKPSKQSLNGHHPLSGR